MLKALAAQALRLADAQMAVQRSLQAAPLAGPVRVLALGKAALAMWQGADAVLGSQVRAGLLIVPESDCAKLPTVWRYPLQCRVGAHPLPDTRSLAAGAAAQQFVADCRADESLLVLLSGGASAMCEALPDGVSLAELQALQQALLASAWPISAINAVRQRLSLIKAGGLSRCCPSAVPVRQLLLSDVPGDDPAVIGSAPFVPAALPLPDWRRLPAPWPTWLQQRLLSSVPTRQTPAPVVSTVIASNQQVRTALAQWAQANGLTVVVNRAIAGDCTVIAAEIAAELQAGPSGVYVYGGESYLQLPPQPGRGGRNQHLALLLQQTVTTACTVLTLATDGVDGCTDAAGACGDCDANSATSAGDRDTALRAANSYDYWRQQGGLLFTGATGTNVADLVLCWKPDSQERRSERC